MLAARKGDRKVVCANEGRGETKVRTGALPAFKGPGSVFDSASPEISENEFQNFQELIYRETGIWLSTAKIPLLTGRLAKHLRHHGMKSFAEYFKLISESPEERVMMFNAISTNETHFFREPKHFELLSSNIFPRWVEVAAAGNRSRSIRVWSAGCSTGQEPYSLAMTLLDYFPSNSGWEIEIIATDLSTCVLDIAKRGIWSAENAAEIPREYLKAFMMKGFADQAGKIKAGPDICSRIRFLRVNLNETTYPFAGKFDLIFCRNVLIYFDIRSRERVVRRLANFLTPDGFFFVGHAESLHAMSDVLSTVVPTVYRLARKPDWEKHGGK